MQEKATISCYILDGEEKKIDTLLSFIFAGLKFRDNFLGTFRDHGENCVCREFNFMKLTIK